MRITWRAVPIVLLILLACATRLPAPWRVDVTNDEMHHLESWRNRYKSPDVYPLFLQKLEASHMLSPGSFELVRKVYYSSRLVQHGLIVLVDPQPPLFPTLAELTAAATDSSLTVLRIWSVLFSLLAIWVAYLIGKEIRGPTCGIWLAVFVCISSLSQVYAGIGRPYALTQLVLLLVFLAFIRRQRDQIGMLQFLLWCLLAQAVQWMAWAVIGPLVIVELVRQIRKGMRFGGLARQTWWYAVISLLMLVEMFIQLRNPVVSTQGGLMPTRFVWWCFSVAAPTGHLGSFGHRALDIGAALFAILCLIGLVVLIRTRERQPWLYLGLVASACGGLLASAIVGVSVRFEVSYITPWLILGTMGIYWLLPRRRLSMAAATLVLVVFGWLSLWHPENPYHRILDYDVRWSQVAQVLKQQLKPGDKWLGFAPSIASNVYRYGPFPEPLTIFRMRDLESEIKDGSLNQAVVLLEVNGNYPDMPKLVQNHIEVIRNFPTSSGPDHYILGRVNPPTPPGLARRH